MFVATFAAALATCAIFGAILLWFRVEDHADALRDMNARQDFHAKRLDALERTARAVVRTR